VLEILERKLLNAKKIGNLNLTSILAHEQVSKVKFKTRRFDEQPKRRFGEARTWPSKLFVTI